MAQVVGISVKMDVRRATASLNDIARKQLPFAIKTALNDVAFQVQTAERANMVRVFKHPRPFTAKSTLVKQATRTNLMAIVYMRPEAAQYILPYEVGGLHVLPGPALLNPKGVSLDPYAQLRKGTPQRLDARPDVFVGTVKGITGWWQRIQPKRPKGGNKPPQMLKLLIRFGVALPVHKSLHFHDLAVAMVRARFLPAFQRVLATAVKKARP